MSRPDASPDRIRACELRILLYLVLEASGIRPGSAYGLTLGDIHLHDAGTDYVHVHRSGEFGEAKEHYIGWIRFRWKASYGLETGTGSGIGLRESEAASMRCRGGRLPCVPCNPERVADLAVLI